MRAARLNPNDTDTFAAFGLHLILIGDSALGRVFMKVALTLNPEPPDWYWFALYFMHFSAGEYEDALEMALRAQNESFYWTHCMQATAYAKLGLQTESRRALDRLLALFPSFPAQARTELERWVNPEQTTLLLEALDEAGLHLE